MSETPERWGPPSTNRWLIFPESIPSDTDTIVLAAHDEGLEDDEVETIARICRKQPLAISPWVRIFPSDEHDGSTVEVIIPPDDSEALDVYRKYNG